MTIIKPYQTFFSLYSPTQLRQAHFRKWPQAKETRSWDKLEDRLSGGCSSHSSDFTLFRAHLAAACRERKMTHDPLCAAAVDLHFAGVRALDICRLSIADELEVMELPKAKAKQAVKEAPQPADAVG